MMGQLVMCKQTFNEYNTHYGYYDFFIKGQLYKVKNIYTDTLVPQKEEVSWIIIGEGLETKSFCANNNEHKVFKSQPNLIDYFYLPEEWREIQLAKLCI